MLVLSKGIRGYKKTYNLQLKSRVELFLIINTDDEFLQKNFIKYTLLPPCITYNWWTLKWLLLIYFRHFFWYRAYCYKNHAEMYKQLMYLQWETILHHLKMKQGHEISGCADVRTNVKGITKSYTMGTSTLSLFLAMLYCISWLTWFNYFSQS